jgi:predicted CXXCH cytochrome family protein
VVHRNLTGIYAMERCTKEKLRRLLAAILVRAYRLSAAALFTATLGAAVLSACQATESQSPTPPPSPRPTATPDQSAERQAWLDGPHADTYSLESGPNTYCARCHSPANWDPAATIDDPPNCVSCKFAFEAEPRQAAGNPLVPQEQWLSIDCQVCHRMEDGHADPDPAWQDPASGYYETVGSSSELCEKCHQDNPTLRHHRDLGDAAHNGYECTECHDAHSAKASCLSCHVARFTSRPRFIPEHQDVNSNDQCRECHADAWSTHDMELQQSGDDNCLGCHERLMGLETIPPIMYGHSEAHQAVNCVACHDASGLTVGPLEGMQLWMAFRTTELLGRETTTPYQSHNLQGSVDCSRCHFQGNSWGLPVEPDGGWNGLYGNGSDGG